MLRKVIFISTMCFILIFNSVQAFAQDIPNGIEPRKLTATLEEEHPGSFLDLLPDGTGGKLSGPLFEGARTSIPYKKKYTLEFYNVGALKGEQYSEATLKIETIATGNGKISTKELSPKLQPPLIQKDAETRPDFKAKEYKLKFSGGPYGRFTYKEGDTEIRMSMSNNGKNIVFDVPGYSTKPLALEDQKAFEAWVETVGKPAAAKQKILGMINEYKYTVPIAGAILLLAGVAVAAFVIWKYGKGKLMPH
ncbi:MULTISPECIES: hypothetical protein [Oscillospiraceae]|uniref:Uncharacterized protein n=1 Tax=Pseudobacteroides cellulosolvens ATCC 35603 = DSM 2933 TaxID=398512 RepID=A0A0L6JTS3_9FIRM|nr:MULTISPECIES: hypothetical protein [Oscillospiraceae]KNY29090.1 hypothetical protein Bccel_4364 [Pseudobacteroides cellulosolvens ATCC 35603 = DSM 2933]